MSHRGNHPELAWGLCKIDICPKVEAIKYQGKLYFWPQNPVSMWGMFHPNYIHFPWTRQTPGISRNIQQPSTAFHFFISHVLLKKQQAIICSSPVRIRPRTILCPWPWAKMQKWSCRRRKSPQPQGALGQRAGEDFWGLLGTSGDFWGEFSQMTKIQWWMEGAMGIHTPC